MGTDRLTEIARERDEARAAAWEIVDSVAAVVSPEVAGKIWQRAIQRYPWLEEERAKQERA